MNTNSQQWEASTSQRGEEARQGDAKQVALVYLDDVPFVEQVGRNLLLL